MKVKLFPISERAGEALPQVQDKVNRFVKNLKEKGYSVEIHFTCKYVAVVYEGKEFTAEKIAQALTLTVEETEGIGKR